MKRTKLEANIAGKGFFQVEISGERIAVVERLGDEQADTPFLSPGFIDTQINGFAGVDFSDPNLNPQSIDEIMEPLWKTGVTSFLPTLVTNAPEVLQRNFQVLETVRKANPQFDQCAPRYHLEGPFLSPGPSHGAHRPELMHAPDWQEFSKYQEAAEGHIGILTIAPEWEGSASFIRKAVQKGVRVSISHTDGLPEDINRAAEAGATMNTHLGNGGPPALDRFLAPFWAQLANDDLCAGMICDGFHLSADLIRIIVRVKGLDRCILVTDAIHVAGLPPGHYEFVGRPIQLKASGQIVLIDSKRMAGSSLSMDFGIGHFMKMTDFSLAEALIPATRNPADFLGLPSLCREVAPGQIANLVLFRIQSGALVVEQTYVAGTRVFG